MPQIYQVQQIARPAYYDRQAIGVLNSYIASLANHPITTRWTYTPVGYSAAFIETCSLTIVRLVAATTPASSATNLIFSPFYGGSYVIAGANLFDNVVNTKDQVIITSLGYMAYGDSLSLQTTNGDTGGLIFFRGTFKGTEFIY